MRTSPPAIVAIVAVATAFATLMAAPVAAATTGAARKLQDPVPVPPLVEADCDTCPPPDCQPNTAECTCTEAQEACPMGDNTCSDDPWCTWLCESTTEVAGEYRWMMVCQSSHMEHEAPPVVVVQEPLTADEEAYYCDLVSECDCLRSYEMDQLELELSDGTKAVSADLSLAADQVCERKDNLITSFEGKTLPDCGDPTSTCFPAYDCRCDIVQCFTTPCPPICTCDGAVDSDPTDPVGCGGPSVQCADGTTVSPDPENGCTTPDCPPIIAGGCTKEAKLCDDGTVVVRDANNNCEFQECPPAPVPATDPVACATDVHVCPDGTYVSRDATTCEFPPCPPCPGDGPVFCDDGVTIVSPDPDKNCRYPKCPKIGGGGPGGPPNKKVTSTVIVAEEEVLEAEIAALDEEVNALSKGNDGGKRNLLRGV